ncbi:hypothetical protein EB796_002674 [Bugula neritina]|uniref:Plasminogen receptor (KT) n=1 Tax=Bugula neritina TaxID=10212 RepID=A0A7J7KKB1_BUGNE|nr:hypothetical protein EB796_002674 [Bugula neritina]
MGSFMSSALEDNMRKQQEFMLANQLLMLERNINMQNAMRERMMATQVARARDLVHWTGSFYGLCVLGLGTAAVKGHKPHLLAPLIPLGFVVGYQWDMAYNGKLKRVTREAENILESEMDLLSIANGMPDLAEIERRRKMAEKDSTK